MFKKLCSKNAHQKSDSNEPQEEEEEEEEEDRPLLDRSFTPKMYKNKNPDKLSFFLLNIYGNFSLNT